MRKKKREKKKSFVSLCVFQLRIQQAHKYLVFSVACVEKSLWNWKENISRWKVSKRVRKKRKKTLSKEINKKNGFEKFFFVLSLYMMKRSANQHHLDSHSYFLFFFYIFKRLKLLTKTRGICKCGGMRMLYIVFFLAFDDENCRKTWFDLCCDGKVSKVWRYIMHKKWDQNVWEFLTCYVNIWSILGFHTAGGEYIV